MAIARLLQALLLLLAALVPATSSQGASGIDLPAVLALAGQRLSAVASPAGGVWITATDPATGSWVREPTPERWTSGALGIGAGSHGQTGQHTRRALGQCCWWGAAVVQQAVHHIRARRAQH